MEQPLLGLGLPLGSPGFGYTDVVAAMVLLTSGKPALHPLSQGIAGPLSSWALLGSPKGISG